jgi:cytochrome c-type biogenesis protein CcmH/NrfG
MHIQENSEFICSWCFVKYSGLKLKCLSCVILPGVMLQGRGQVEEAMSAYINALLLDPSFVRCKILIGALLSKRDSNALPVARSILSDALKIEPTNRMAWYYLGIIHRVDGRIADAADCFQAASMLEESDPIENFSSIL